MKPTVLILSYWQRKSAFILNIKKTKKNMARLKLPKELYRSYRADIKFNEKEWQNLCELANEEEMTVP